MMLVTRRETFSAAHRLYNPAFTDEENLRTFGKCSNPNWHGHNYTLEVVVAGEVNQDTGFVIDLSKLKSIIREHIISKVDHKNLNTETDFMQGINPTSENIVLGIWRILSENIPEGKLYSVKLYETENNFFEYKGEQVG
jgi:6-pyruvoyltetrahydropterin/6-carboxytetrahydropterin synthase